MQISKLDIDGNTTVKNCSKCGGTGAIIIHDGKPRQTKNPDRQVCFSRAVLCECRRNEIVENSYPVLRNPRLPKISSELAEKFASQYPLTKDFWFDGSIDQFLIATKAAFVYHRKSSKFLGHVSNGLEIVQSYYVEQPKGSERHFLDLVNFRDLVVIIANTRVSNIAVPTCVVELIQGRQTIGKPTWIYTPKDFDACMEYSDNLKALLGDFSHIELKALNQSKQKLKGVL